MRILYLVHDLADPAVQKRVAMLQGGGAEVTLAGFRRTAEPVKSVAGCTAIDFGRTYNGGFVQRLGSVLRQVMVLRRHRAAFAAADLILARNLEMLAIGVRGRNLARRKTTLVYECLDIHRLLLNGGTIGFALRALEGWLAKRAAALITSSPAFVSEYFAKISRVRRPVILIENKIYPPPPVLKTDIPRRAGPPWRIGWFGALRCQSSLSLLSDLVRRSNGTVEVILRGNPALDQFDDFAKWTTETAGLCYLGPYANPGDLAAIYRDVHFTWAIDRFEAEQNSAWLLPNRLYEGGRFAAVALAEKAVETGRFLDHLDIGVRLEEPLATSLAEFFATLTPQKYRALEAAAETVPAATWVADSRDCSGLVAALKSLT